MFSIKYLKMIGMPSISFLALCFNSVVLPILFLLINTELLLKLIFKRESSIKFFPSIYIVNERNIILILGITSLLYYIVISAWFSFDFATFSKCLFCA